MSNKNLFGEKEQTEYEKFTSKFDAKLTTDDCYTPPNVYEWILSYVKEKCNISEDAIILRPFKPGGDYKNEEYPNGCIVIDNPPFSILSQICKFYNENGVKYFLFAPHLTLFGSVVECTRIVASCDIVYHNGAQVKTSFVSNLFGDLGVIADPAYRKAIKQIQNADKKKLPKYKYPENVVTVSRLAAIVERGGYVELEKSDLRRISMLESQKRHKKAIFGSGFLIGNNKAEELKAEELKAEELKAEELKAEELKAEELKAEEQIIIWGLSTKEKNIIAQLDGKGLPFVEQKLF